MTPCKKQSERSRQLAKPETQLMTSQLHCSMLRSFETNVINYGLFAFFCSRAATNIDVVRFRYSLTASVPAPTLTNYALCYSSWNMETNLVLPQK